MIKTKAIELTAFLVALAGCNTVSAQPTAQDLVNVYDEPFRSALNSYKELPNFKAFALAMDCEGNWAYGYGDRHLTQISADHRAMEECTWRAPIFGVEAKCQIYARGNTVLSSSELTSPCKTD